MVVALFLPAAGCLQGNLLDHNNSQDGHVVRETLTKLEQPLRQINKQASYEALYWDGSAQKPVKNTITGGSGTWNASNNNWTNMDASEALTWSQSTRGVAIFSGSEAGTVQIGDSPEASWLTFSTDGYRLTGSPLLLTPASFPPNEAYAGFGIAQGRAYIEADIKEATSGTLAPLEVRVLGRTIVFTGNKSYDGQTSIRSNSKLVLGDEARGTGARLRSNIAFDSGNAALDVFIPNSTVFTNVLSSEDTTAELNLTCQPPSTESNQPKLLEFASNSASFAGTSISDGCNLSITGNLGGDIVISTANAMLSGTGIAGTAGRTVSIVGAILAPGNFNRNEHGRLTVSGNLSLSGTPQKSALCAFDLFEEAAANNDSVRVGGSLAITDTVLQVKGGTPGTYDLFAYTDTYTGPPEVFTAIQGRDDFDYEVFNDESAKTITLVIQPKSRRSPSGPVPSQNP